MRKRLSIVVMAFALVSAVGGAQAQDKADCKELPQAQDLSNLSLGVIVGPKVNFVADETDKAECPSAGPACRRRAFLRARERIVFAKDATKAGYVCAAYVDGKGSQTTGWLPQASVKPATAPLNWIGAWKRNGNADIDIKRKTATSIDVSGSATWGSAAMGNLEAPFVGDLSADFDPKLAVQGFSSAGKSQVAYGKGDDRLCAALMSQMGPYLFVVDNMNCGGLNVTFTGLYTRR